MVKNKERSFHSDAGSIETTKKIDITGCQNESLCKGDFSVAPDIQVTGHSH